jgi:hypothetical protein
MELASDIVGTVGVACFLTAYFLLENGRLTHTSGHYLSLNLAGALLVMLSLLVDWNLPAFLLEAAWAMITLYGLYKHIYLPKRKP